jgi:hypothetical protein
MYIVLVAARDLGSQAGDYNTALAAVDKLRKTFRVDPLPMKLKVLEEAAPVLVSAADVGAMYTRSLEVLDELLSIDDFEGAKRALAVALGAARRSGKRELVTQVTTRKEKVDELKRAFDRVAGALHLLIRSPDDPAANAAVGKYLCLVKLNWEKGLPLLVRGDDDGLRELAASELNKPLAGVDQANLADEWWNWSEKQSGSPLERRGARLRAAHWYKQALAGLPASLAKERAKQRIAAAEQNDGYSTKQSGGAAKNAPKSGR